MDDPAAIVQPSVHYRPHDNPGNDRYSLNKI
jgi:hypothetical protein